MTMARLRRVHVVNAACALAVIILYFKITNARSSASDSNLYGAGDPNDVLSYVNMFIGTRNGGKLFGLTKARALIVCNQATLSQEHRYLMV
jgi:hypothetical protein